MGYTWLKNASVDSNASVDLATRNIVLDFRNFMDTPPSLGKSIGSPYEYRLSQVRWTGFENPKYIIEGVITQSDTNLDGSKLITIPKMASFCFIGSPSWFHDDRLVVNYAGSIQVIPESFTATRDTQGGTTVNLGDILKYNLTLRETSRW